MVFFLHVHFYRSGHFSLKLAFGTEEDMKSYEYLLETISAVLIIIAPSPQKVRLVRPFVTLRTGYLTSGVTRTCGARGKCLCGAPNY